MNQFRIKGIDYVDESLQHGLGKGSGRGRPKGSKNGQVMPGAAYMKGYEIVGQKAVGDSSLPTATNTSRFGTARQARIDGRPVSGGKSAARQARNGGQKTVGNGNATQQTSAGSRRPASVKTSAATPATSVAAGKNAVFRLLSGTSTSQPTAATPQQESTTAPKQQGGFRWSAQNVNAAGGLEAREGRQIVYDNPTLSEDYKRQVAKRFGDSDGRSYPKAMEKASEAETQSEVDPASVRSGDSTDTGSKTRMPPIDPSKLRASNGVTSGVSYNGAQPGSEQVQTEQVIPEQVQTEQVLQEQAPESTQPAAQQETPEQKGLWDSITGWLSQAGKDIGDTVVGAWNTASGAVNDAAKWVGDRVNEAGEWAKTAYNDVSNWVGSRAQEFGNWISNAAGDVGRAASNAVDSVLGSYQVVGTDRNWNPIYGNQRRGGFLNAAGQWIGNAANDAGQWIGNAANDAGRWIGNTANNVADSMLGSYQVVGTDKEGNPIYGNQRQGGFVNAAGQWIGNAANDVGQWVGNAANDVGRAANELWNGRDVEVNDNGHWRQGHTPGVREQVGNAVNNAGQWVNNNVVTPVTNAANAAGQWVGNAANDVRNAAINATDSVFGSYPVIGGYTDGRPIFGNQRRGGFINDAGQWVNDNVATPVTNAANDAGRWIGNATNAAGQWVSNAANDVRNAAVNATDSVFGSYPVVGTDDQGNPIFGNQRQGGFVNAAGQWVGNAANDVGRFATNTADNVFGRYPVVDTDENGNLVYGNQRQGGLLNNAAVDARRWATREAGPWLNENIVTPATNAANAAGQWVNNAANDAGQWIGNAANDAGQWVSNAANDAGQWIGDTANNVGRAANEWWNGTDQSFLGIKTGHTPGARENIARAANDAGRWVSNAANDAGQWVSNAANDVGQWAGNTVDSIKRRSVAGGLSRNAVSAGVPSDTVNQLTNEFYNGHLTEGQYRDAMNDLINDYSN